MILRTVAGHPVSRWSPIASPGAATRWFTGAGNSTSRALDREPLGHFRWARLAPRTCSRIPSSASAGHSAASVGTVDTAVIAGAALNLTPGSGRSSRSGATGYAPTGAIDATSRATSIHPTGTQHERTGVGLVRRDGPTLDPKTFADHTAPYCPSQASQPCRLPSMIGN
jgi:hypothetical protein